ncbi:MAG TPA: pyridoxal-phosphate dependent enzyme, partial [Longimicrobium sp.]|nr:pyridoxal-phosphate dependent enzyme [Longimicrobium sp.]
MIRAGLPTADDVRAAAERLRGVAHRTPVHTSRTLDGATGASVFLKCENFQRGGAFKFRGAYNAVSLLSDAERARGVVTFSSGNHAQAIALTGRLLGVKVVVVMPMDAPAAKIEGTRGYGAEVILYDRAGRPREEIADELQRERGMA